MALSKTWRIVSLTVNGLFAVMILLSAAFKLFGGEKVVAQFQLVGVSAAMLPLFAFCEIGIALLLLYPRTTRLAVVLSLAYFSGALAMEITHAAPLAAITMVVMTLVVGILRVPEVFTLREKTA